MPRVLYSFRRCPYAMRARLALAASRQECELREVVLRNKPEALLQASPKGTVPVLVLPDGTVIDQSLDIMLWALQQNDPEGWLQPPAGDLAQMLALIAECDGSFKHGLDRYKYPERYEDVDPLVHRAACASWMSRLEFRLAHASAGISPEEPGLANATDLGHVHLFGARPSLADAAIFPFVRQFAQVDRAWFDAQPWPGVHAWLAAWLGATLFAIIMARHAPWDGAQGVAFP
jgi:glutathione S-transferase